MSRSSQITPDPLFMGEMEMKKSDLPKLTSGKDIFDELEKRIESDVPLDTVLNAPEKVMEFFEKVFPDLVESNKIGQISKDAPTVWSHRDNTVTVEIDPVGVKVEDGKDVYIGGPAALMGAVVQSKCESESKNVFYCHDGNRGFSNWKGSASYFHIRDAMPVYHSPDNGGLFLLYTAAKHALQRKLFYKSYINEVHNAPNWNKLRLDLKSVIKNPTVTILFLKNFLYSLRDLGIPFIGPISSRETAITYTTMDHAYLSHQISDNLKPKKPIIMKSNQVSKSLHVHLGQDTSPDMANTMHQELMYFAGHRIAHSELSKNEISERGYDTEFVEQAEEFHQDGYIPPYVDQMFEEMVKSGGGEVKDNIKLKKILVAPTENRSDVKVSRIVFMDIKTGLERSIPVKSLYISLGPSMNNLKVIPPRITLFPQTKNSKLESTGEPQHNNMRYSNNISSVINSAIYSIKSKNILQKMIWAAGNSVILLVKVDKSKVSEQKMKKFRDHVGGANKHIVRLAEKEVRVPGTNYQLFVVQATAGGRFPARDVHAETALNVLKANLIPLYGLENCDGIEYDVLSVRSCARGVTSQNAFRFSAPASNMVMIYGIGGIGMTTMVPNGLLMKAIMGARQQLADEKIDESEFQRILKQSDFKNNITHWSHPNPFDRNYAQFVDFVSNPKEIARRVGLETFPNKTSINFQRIRPLMKNIVRMIKF